ncbi:sensor domain-containing diguanylate cyclase [Methylopila sp. 73B]|uniref:sensor domain-containing diguanylate cyclase n=1 Tax=Methylopila sp. 73B TaxID=1120792 RepID=UPI00036AFFB6|nr:sensor domain-containing diguanylate cyclase [Methylopila sp. 73B]
MAATRRALSIRERRLLDALASPVLVVTGDDVPVLIAMNPAARRLLGRSSAGRPTLERAIGAEAAAALAKAIASMAQGGPGPSVTVACGAAGMIRFDLGRDPRDPGLVMIALRGATDALSAIDELAQMRSVLESLPVGVEIYDRDFNALFYNGASDALFDYEGAAVLSHGAWWRHAFPDPALRRAAREDWRRTIAAAKADPSRAHMREWTVRARDGDTRTVQFYYRFLGDRFTLVLWDVTEQRRMESELRAAARTDALTGVANRRRFAERLAHDIATARSRGEPLALIALDIDHFKAINDRFGHAVGDEVLKAVAKRAAGALRHDDMIARVGGEEFAALLPRATGDEAKLVADRLHRAIVSLPIALEGLTLGVTISLGGALLRAEDAAPETLTARADAALYAAKARGRNRVAFEGD